MFYKHLLLNPITGGDKTDAYRSFLSNVNRSRVINGLPTELKFGNDETVENFTSHCLSWHRSRHVKYNNQKLAKKEKTAEKRTHSPNESTQMPPKQRTSSSRFFFFFFFFFLQGPWCIPNTMASLFHISILQNTCDISH